MTHALEVASLTKHYGDVRAVDGLDLAVPAGSIFGFLGPNGAGKTTTIRMMVGLIRPDSGEVRIGGHDVRSDRQTALRNVGAVVETPSLYPNLTGRETLDIARRHLGLGAGEVDRVLDLLDLREAADRRVRHYSLGMRQRLALARALMGRPETLILDEPTNGLDPSGIADLRGFLTRLSRDEGVTIFLSSHLLDEVEKIADHCALIDSGRSLYQGTVEDLLASAGREVRIETDTPDIVERVAAEAGVAVERVSATRCVWRGLDPDARAAHLSAAIAQGAVISGFTPVRPSLETLFLALTRDAA